MAGSLRLVLLTPADWPRRLGRHGGAGLGCACRSGPSRVQVTATGTVARMKLAMLAPIAWRTPPRHYGPWESVASLLTEGLVARGVDVTLFATLDSVTAATLDGVCPHGYAEDASLDGRVW